MAVCRKDSVEEKSITPSSLDEEDNEDDEDFITDDLHEEQELPASGKKHTKDCNPYIT